MTITAHGFDETVEQDDFSALMRLQATSNQPQVVESWAPAVATGTRLVSWGTGRLVAAGVLAVNADAGTTTFAANSSGNPRIDVLVAKVDWALKTVSMAVVQGTAAANPVAPALTQTEGTTWHVPIARVTIANGAGQLAAGTVEDCRPLRTVVKIQRADPDVISIGASASPRTVATISVADPGWPYRLRISGVCNFAQITSGRGEISAVVDGVELTTGRAPSGNDGPAVLRTAATNSRTGAATVLFKISPAGSPSGQIAVVATHSGFLVEVVPA